MADFTARVGGSGSGLNISNLRDAHNISVSNFQSCFVNNKAEKFKLRRVSQGIDGVAQARLMEYRKEERKMQKLLETFEKDKTMNCRSDYNIHHSSKASLINNDSRKVCKNCKQTPLATSESIAINKDNADEKASHHKPDSHRDRRTSSKPRFEITPFYMEHGYQHYHYDPYYDELSKNKTDQWEDGTNGDIECCWLKYDKIRKWEQKHRKSMEIESKYLEDFTSRFKTLENAISATNLESNVRKESLQSTPSTHSKSISFHDQIEKVSSERNAHINTDGLCKKCIRDLSVKASSSAYFETSSQSLLTDSERQQLKNRRGLIPPHMSEQQISKDKEPAENSPIITYTNPAEVEKIRQVVRRRLSRGESIVDMSHDAMFDNILEVCDSDRIFPAYKTNSELTFVDYQSLRKCKYLRESDMNKQSLKEATIRHLVENQS